MRPRSTRIMPLHGAASRPRSTGAPTSRSWPGRGHPRDRPQHRNIEPGHMVGDDEAVPADRLPVDGDFDPQRGAGEPVEDLRRPVSEPPSARAWARRAQWLRAGSGRAPPPADRREGERGSSARTILAAFAGRRPRVGAVEGRRMAHQPPWPPVLSPNIGPEHRPPPPRLARFPSPALRGRIVRRRSRQVRLTPDPCA